MQLVRKSMIFDFSVQYHQKNPQWKQNPVFKDSILAEFKEYLAQREFEYECECSRDLERIKNFLDTKKYPDEVSQLLVKLENQLNNEIDKEFDRSSDQISEFLYLDLVEKYFDRKERERISLLKDKQANEAVRILQDLREYRRILAIK